jgi:hypothetical protein
LPNCKPSATMSLRMIFRTPQWILTGKVVAACIAGAGIAMLYRSGLADIGGVLVLSAIIVSVITFVRSGALSASWLSHQNPNSIIRLGHFELAKAFASAGIGIDLFRTLVAAVRRGLIPRGMLTGAIILSVAVIAAMGAGLFLVRWLAAYLLIRRRRLF